MFILKIIRYIKKIQINIIIKIKIMNDTNYGNVSYGGIQNNYGTARPSASGLIAEKVTEFVLGLKLSGHIGKDLLGPYIAAVEMGYAPQLTCEEFNMRYQTDLKSTTYNNWTSPVFHGILNASYQYEDNELSYYRTVYEEIIHSA